MFWVVARRRDGRQEETSPTPGSALLACIFRPMESFTLWAGVTEVMSSSRTHLNTTRWPTHGRRSQQLTPTPLQTTLLAAYSPTLGHRTFTAWAGPSSGPIS